MAQFIAQGFVKYVIFNNTRINTFLGFINLGGGGGATTSSFQNGKNDTKTYLIFMKTHFLLRILLTISIGHAPGPSQVLTFESHCA